MTPSIDVVIPIHDPRRPIGRAVEAVRRGSEALVRVTVVAHNTNMKQIEQQVAGIPQVRVLELQDGIRSPAGPMNVGLAAATAPWLSVIGSDDTVTVGAYAEWLDFAERTSSDVVIPRLRHAGGPALPTPPTRPFRQTCLDPVRDRLSYRSAPLGIFSRAQFGMLRMAEGVPTGEDIPFVTELWFSGARIGYHRTGPAYQIHDDVTERTSFAVRRIQDEFAWLKAAEQAAVRLTAVQRRALGAKLLRVNLFGAILNRGRSWTITDREALAEVAHRVIEIGAGIETALARADQRLLQLALQPGSPDDELVSAAIARRRFLRPAALFPRNLARSFDREGPLRVAAASWLQR